MCGPILLGTSPVDQPWLAGRVDWGFPTDGAVTGQFDRFDGDTVGDPGELVRPDGREPGGEVPAAPTSGLRTADGERVQDPQVVLDETAAVLARVGPDQGANVADDAACWFGTSSTDGRTVTDDSIWCGPVLTVDSDPAAFWARTTTGFADDDGLPSTATISAPDDLAVFTRAVDDGVVLWRPDGGEPPTSTDLALPDARPLEPGTVLVLDTLPAPPDTEAPADGVLRTPFLAWTITGLARTDQVGSGPEALIAPADHDLVVATSTFAPVGDAGPAGRRSRRGGRGRRRGHPPHRRGQGRRRDLRRPPLEPAARAHLPGRSGLPARCRPGHDAFNAG